MEKALKTYLNGTGVGDYELAKSLGDKMVESSKVNLPNWSLKGRVKMGWFPQRNTDFMGQSSPPPTKYQPPTDRPFKNSEFSVGK